MVNKRYIHRELEQELLERAGEFPVLVLTGPRQTGKSTLLKRLFHGHQYVSLDDPLIRKQAADDPHVFLENYTPPVLVDEIQYAPQLLPYIKTLVDQDRGKNGAYILTGSQMFPLMQGISESLAGRAALFELLGFSLAELSPVKKMRTVRGCYELIFQGAFPEVCVHHADVDTFYNSYIQTYLERDVRQIRAVHDLNVFQNFLELLAARCGSLLNLNEISKECGVSAATARNWLSILEISRVIYLLRPYHKNISKRVVKSPKVYFTDTGLLSYILRYPDAATLQKGPLSGQVFENFIVMEMLKHKFNYNKRYELYFYRDSNHNEADMIIDMGYKNILVEIKQTKTLQERHWKQAAKIADELDIEERFVVSNCSDNIQLSHRVRNVPWWSIAEVV
ncbi:MAG: ATP-binding protein [Candidatus Omnitrophota bacterium]